MDSDTGDTDDEISQEKIERLIQLEQGMVRTFKTYWFSIFK